MDISASDGTIIQIWNDIKSGGLELYVFILLTIIFLLKNHLITFFTWCGDVFKKLVFKQKKEYNKRDILKHPIFKDMDFWLNSGIKAIKFTLIPSLFNIKHTQESDEYLKAKELISHDMLIIKMETLKKYLKELVDNLDYDDLVNYDVKEKFLEMYKRCKYEQQQRFITANIPAIFLTKYFAQENLARNMVVYMINAYFDDVAVTAPTETRIYLTLTFFNAYLTEILNNIISTVTIMNGDLVGVEYKGHIIGNNNMVEEEDPQ